MWEGVGDRTKTAIYWPPKPLRTSPCVVLVLLGCSTASCHQRFWSPNSLGVPKAPSAGWWLSLPHLVSKSSELQLTDFLSSPSNIIGQLPTQSLEWHVWSSPTGNNCHAVHWSLSCGASVYECTMGFYLVPYYQPSPPTWFLLITAIGMCHFLSVHHWYVWPGRKSIYNTLSLWKCNWPDLKSGDLFRRNLFLNSLKTST